MHRSFRKSLDRAHGYSEFPIVINVDIRGFSDWSLKVDSAQTGLYVKQVYAKLIDDYFAEASFLKATGDGLLVVMPIDEAKPSRAIRSAVDRSFRIIERFPTLTAKDPMINFDTPRAVGIGLSRGAASRLATRSRTLDYSGRTLNLASRLMDLARPRGIVMDGRFGRDLLTKSVRDRFEIERVYIKGIAPRDGLDVYFTPEYTELPASAKQPLDEPRWGSGRWTTTLRELKEMGVIANYEVQLDSTPMDPKAINCVARHDAPLPSGRKSRSRWVQAVLNPAEFRYEVRMGTPVIWVSIKALIAALEKTKAGDNWPVEVMASFEAA